MKIEIEIEDFDNGYTVKAIRDLHASTAKTTRVVVQDIDGTPSHLKYMIYDIVEELLED